MTNLFSDDYQTKRRIGLGVFLSFAFIYFAWSLSADVNRDINSMDAHELYEQLQEVPHIDESEALIIIENRPYRSWGEVKELNGIPNESLKYLNEKFTLIYPIIANRFSEGGELFEIRKTSSNHR